MNAEDKQLAMKSPAAATATAAAAHIVTLTHT